MHGFFVLHVCMRMDPADIFLGRSLHPKIHGSFYMDHIEREQDCQAKHARLSSEACILLMYLKKIVKRSMHFIDVLEAMT